MQTYQIRVYEPGKRPWRMQPGDVVLTHAPGIATSLIRFGQLLRYRRKDERPFAWFTHAALVINGHGDLIESQAPKGMRLRDIREYDDVYYVYVSTGMDYVDAHEAMTYAHAALDSRASYGWLQIASIGLALVTGGRLTLGVEGTAICSGFVAEALARAGFIFRRRGRLMSTAHVMPADLAAHFELERVRE